MNYSFKSNEKHNDTRYSKSLFVLPLQAYIEIIQKKRITVFSLNIVYKDTLIR